ncbi:MAG: L-aspartate oxidase [Thermodesulfobacteriota bacterium]
MKKRSDFLVIGTGIAGLSFALKAARAGTVTLVTKRDTKESATYYAQGGIASVLGHDDTFDSHIRDTTEAGCGLCHPEIVDMVVREAPRMIEELISIGVEFTRGASAGADDGALDLGREGGHARRRIVHAGDITGREVEKALIARAGADGNITVLEDHMAVDLLTHSKLTGERGGERVWGAYVLDKSTGDIEPCAADVTVLAAGGAGKVYLYTSNPDVATGDGIAMARRAGAETANMEFMQFHPTCLYHPEAKSFLISEAVRGEGAVLRLADGTAFMKKYHEMADLAPRDIVARAIDFELKKSGLECVYLDITHRPARFIRDRFPNIHARCLDLGFDMTREPLPVVPAAHYICGGVKADHRGRTTIDGLYAIGECASTGLHGANRLASNSLIESLVFADHAAHDAAASLKDRRVEMPAIPDWQTGGAVPSDEAVVITQNWEEIRRFMWNYVGIVRSDKRLERARSRIDLLVKEIDQYYWDFMITSDLLELRNIATVSELIIRCASARKESRGLHYNIDHPATDDVHFKKDTVIKPGD